MTRSTSCLTSFLLIASTLPLPLNDPYVASCGFQDAQLDMQAGCHRHVHQGIEAEQVDFPAQQVGHAWLRDAEPAGGLGLRPTVCSSDLSEDSAP